MVYKSYSSFKPNPIWILILINFLLFVGTSISQELIFLLGLQPAGFSARPLTILTSLFVHVGFWHVLANMITLYFFGRYISNLVGEGKFSLVYFGGGILGSVFFILMAPSFAVGVGASGAIFALGGALAMLRPRVPVLIFPIPVPIPLWIAVIGGFFILSFLPFVAWQAHLGGLIFGLVAGYLFKRRQRYYYF